MPGPFYPFVASLVFGDPWDLGRLNRQFLSSTLSLAGTNFVTCKPSTLIRSGWKKWLFPTSFSNFSASGYCLGFGVDQLGCLYWDSKLLPAILID